MDSPVAGEILLVGEGDFSFCVAMVTKLPCNTHACITATSLESETSIQKHKNAMENIQWLRDRGVIVCLNVDATRLHLDSRFHDQQFSRIIFNFPHVGGKSNHKKNRQLLNDFFCSAVTALQSEGYIMMTLCKGQGGTPADRPMRAWHDSWQVVSMAANAGLILTEIVPFVLEEYTTYASTGFRSLDKGFHTDNALTHVFERRLAVPLPGETRYKKLTIGGQVYSCPAYLYNKLLGLSHVYNKCHPINRVCQDTVQCLSTANAFNCDTLKNHGIWSPFVATATRTCDPDICVSTAGNVGNANSCYEMFGSYGYRLTKHEGAVSGGEEEIDIVCKGISTEGSELAFRNHAPVFSTVEENLPNIGDMCIQYGPIFRPCMIGPGQSVVTFHMTVTWLLTCKSLDHKSASQEYLEEILNAPIVQILKEVIDRDDIMVKFRENNKSKPLPSDEESANRSLLGHLVCEQHTVECELESQPAEVKDDDSNTSELCSVFLHHVKNVSRIYATLELNLCNLAMYRYKIKDKRLLWSQDHNVVKQFENLGDATQENSALNNQLRHVANPSLSEATESSKNETQSGHNCVHESIPHFVAGRILTSIEPELHLDVDKSDCSANSVPLHSKQTVLRSVTSPSLYPMTFKHDMSFWENKDIKFDELMYCDVIRDIASDNVITVELLDMFYDAGSDRTSRCYRLTFQSVDKALAYNTSWKLQSVIRLEVEKCLKITLR